MGPRYYRRDGTPYPEGSEGLFAWGRDLQDIDKKRVAHDSLPNGVEVSTVWLGLDHNFFAHGRPLIFETMLFVKQKSKFTFRGRTTTFNREPIGEQWRYSTEEEALRGHKMQVKKWSKFKSIDQVMKENK